MWVTAVTLCPGVAWGIEGHTIPTWIAGACQQIEQRNTSVRRFLVRHLRPLGAPTQDSLEPWRSNAVLQGIVDVLMTTEETSDEHGAEHPNTWDESTVFDRIMTDRYDRFLAKYLGQLGSSLGASSPPPQSPWTETAIPVIDLR